MIDSEQFAGVLYETYCAAVGRFAFDGKPLPDWQAFRADASKLRQSDAWIAVADKAVVECAIRRGESLATARRASGFTINRLEAQGPGQLVTCRTGEAVGGQFSLSKDGWIMVVPNGRKQGVLRTYDGDEEKREDIMQEFDDAAFSAMVEDWNKRKAEEGANFPGVLIDFDHFSHDETKPTEAAGWIEDVEVRDDGLWGLPRWSALGKEKLEGGIYRLVSPVLREFEEVGSDKVDGKRLLRPKVLHRLALTNDPQLRGMPPVSNRQTNKDDKDDKDKTMDFKKLILKLLGLPDTATDDEITAAASAYNERIAAGNSTATELKETKSRLTAREAELAASNTARAELLATVIEYDATKFGAFVRDRDELKRQLTENREGTIRALALIIPKTPAAPARKPLHDARNRQHPGNPDGVNVDASVENAGKVGLRARDIMRERKGISFDRAFSMAQREIMPVNGDA